MAEGWRAYNLSSDKDSGIGAWSAEDLGNYLKTGHSADKGSAFGPMAQAVHLSFQKLTPSDVNAIVTYVRSVPAVSTPDLPAPKLEAASADPSDHAAADSNERGHLMFASVCAGCHSWTGTGSYVPHATLTGTRAVNDPTATNVALAVLRGASTLPPSGDIAVMPAFGAGVVGRGNRGRVELRDRALRRQAVVDHGRASARAPRDEVTKTKDAKDSYPGGAHEYGCVWSRESRRPLQQQLR